MERCSPSQPVTLRGNPVDIRKSSGTSRLDLRLSLVGDGHSVLEEVASHGIVQCAAEDPQCLKFLRDSAQVPKLSLLGRIWEAMIVWFSLNSNTFRLCSAYMLYCWVVKSRRSGCSSGARAHQEDAPDVTHHHEGFIILFWEPPGGFLWPRLKGWARFHANNSCFAEVTGLIFVLASLEAGPGMPAPPDHCRFHHSWGLTSMMLDEYKSKKPEQYH
eukprot:2450850-Amphidinium_carterae.1